MSDALLHRDENAALSPSAIAVALETLADEMAEGLDGALEGEARQQFDGPLGKLRRVCSAVREMALLFDAHRAEALAGREQELQAIVQTMGDSVRDLAGVNERVAGKVGEQMQELDAIAALPPGQALTQRLQGAIHSVQEATLEVRSGLSAMSQDVEAANQRIAALERELDQARELARRDGLTRLYSRAALDEALKAASREAGADGPWCFLMADIDHFKAVNDRYGHTAGDALLFKISRVMEASLPQATGDGFLARYGGEEFGIILRGATLEAAAQVAERIRESVAATRWEYLGLADCPLLGATISIGVAQFRPESTVAELVNRADQALYEAKGRGRNRVVLAEP